MASPQAVQDGEAYLQELPENQELAFRIMTVREHLATEVTDFPPEMTRPAKPWNTAVSI